MTESPAGVTFTPSPDSWMDMALGQFIRSLPRLERLLFLTASAATGKSIGDQEVDPATKAIEDIEKKINLFPESHRLPIGRAMVAARRIFDIRHSLVHGMWSEVEGKPMTFSTTLPIRGKRATRHHLEREGVIVHDGLTESDPASSRLTFNRDTILKVHAQAVTMSNWLDDCLYLWEEHFGVESSAPDD